MPPACDQVAVAREAAEAREREQGGGSPSLTQLLSLAPETLRAWLRSSLAVRGGAEAEEAAEASAARAAAAEAAAEAEAEEEEEEEEAEAEEEGEGMAIEAGGEAEGEAAAAAASNLLLRAR